MTPLAQLLAAADHAGKSLETLAARQVLHPALRAVWQPPFVWHVWDGLRDGFAALVNYHKFDYKTLEALIYTYLGDWISRQKRDADNGVDGAQEKLAAAEALKKRLETDPGGRGALRHLRPLETDRRAAHRLEPRSERRRAPQHPPLPFCARRRQAWSRRVARQAEDRLGEGSWQRCDVRTLVRPRPTVRRQGRRPHQ